MYNNKKVLFKNNKGKKVLKYLFNKISKNPSKYFSTRNNKSTIFRQISDYISGMTDRFALNLYNKIKMNIFDNYLEVIYKLIKEEKNKGKLLLPNNLNSITVEIPPEKYNCDLSTNVAMVLSKINNKSPLEIAEQLKSLLSKIPDISEVIIAKPGFINIKLNNYYWSTFVKDILSNPKKYGANFKEEKINYLIEFVSANPTGPLHVGHCRGAILGDVISNLLTFNNHKVTKEYYVNDYGNQILFFTKSIYLRIREYYLKRLFH